MALEFDKAHYEIGRSRSNELYTIKAMSGLLHFAHCVAVSCRQTDLNDLQELNR